MFHEFFLALISGALVKVVDELDDKKKAMFVYAFGIVYGIAIGYIISQASFSMLFLGALLAQLLAGKIDKKSHMLGFIFSILSILYFGIPKAEVFPLLVFLFLAFLDEQIFRKPLTLLNELTKWRLFLKIGALLFALSGRIDYFIAIIIFDASYIFIDMLVLRIKK